MRWKEWKEIEEIRCGNYFGKFGNGFREFVLIFRLGLE